MRSVVVLLASAMTAGAAAEETQDVLQARLVKQPLYLRGQWNGDDLVFDGAGILQGHAETVSFTVSGVEIDSVKLTSKELDLDGQRVGLKFTQDVPQRVPLLISDRPGITSPEKVTIKIQAPADGDFTSALDAIFATSIAGMLPVPDYWQQFAGKHLLPAKLSDAPGGVSQLAVAPATPATVRIGNGVSVPQVLEHAEPGFSGPARALKYVGTVLVSLIVGEDGLPRHVQVVRPAGLGLDEKALEAVSKYKFKPAMRDGTPVAVMLQI
jgi:TonB family protein